jgi:hypothetical protein
MIRFNELECQKEARGMAWWCSVLCLVHLVALFSRKLLKFIGVTRMCAAANGKFNIIIASRNGM